MRITNLNKRKKNQSFLFLQHKLLNLNFENEMAKVNDHRDPIIEQAESVFDHFFHCKFENVNVRTTRKIPN